MTDFHQTLAAAQATKICTSCRFEKPRKEFHVETRALSGLRATCKGCRKASGEYEKTKERQKAVRKATFFKRHSDRAPRACIACNGWFIPRRAGGTPQTTCSRTCRAKIENARPRSKERSQLYRLKNPNHMREWCAKRKLAVLNGYGPVCVCCGESRVAFLSIDHIGGGGREHRAQIGSQFYGWLIKNNFPPGFRVLCMNCNFAIRYGDPCPHEIDRQRMEQGA